MCPLERYCQLPEVAAHDVFSNKKESVSLHELIHGPVSYAAAEVGDGDDAHAQGGARRGERTGLGNLNLTQHSCTSGMLKHVKV